MRYGIGEALFKFDDNMEAEPCLAVSAETDDYITQVIKLKESGKSFWKKYSRC